MSAFDLISTDVRNQPDLNKPAEELRSSRFVGSRKKTDWSFNVEQNMDDWKKEKFGKWKNLVEAYMI